MRPDEAQAREFEADVMAKRLKGIAYARAAGVAVGVFLIFWAPFNALRWAGQGPSVLLSFALLFFITYGALLAMPWQRLRSERVFRFFFGVLIAFSIAFGFVMVIDLIYQYMLAAEFADKPAPPAFQGMLVFAALMQVPVVLFARRPELLG
ncbi:MAG: hypothetical protein AAGF10_01350 [Verrucomicrobiota bacterium]